MGGAPRNPAPRNHLLVWIVKPSGCHCTDAFDGKNVVECPPLLGALPLSLTKGLRPVAQTPTFVAPKGGAGNDEANRAIAFREFSARQAKRSFW